MRSSADRVPGFDRRQRGVAVLMALALVAIATLVVSGLFWQQQVALRSVQNQLSLAQARWIERAAMEQVRWVLQRDAETSGAVDHLKEMWAQPLPETELDANVAGGEKIADERAQTATLSGGIVDEQSRFNLANLVVGGKRQEKAVTAFEKLLKLLGGPTELANATANYLVQYGAQPQSGTGSSSNTSSTSAGTAGVSGMVMRSLTAVASSTTSATVADTAPQAQVVPETAAVEAAQRSARRLLRATDLSKVMPLDPEVLARLLPFVTMLPAPTPINLNTASAPVLAAVSSEMSLAQAQRVVGRREQAWFRTVQELAQVLPEIKQFDPTVYSVNSQWFTGMGVIRYERVQTQVDTLMYRQGREVELVERRIR